MTATSGIGPAPAAPWGPGWSTNADGRTARSRRTHLRLVQAVIELVEEGDRRPTAQSVADRAGVALRTVYHHFGDADELRVTALRLECRRRAGSIPAVEPGMPLEDRITLVVRQLAKLYESITPICRAEQATGEPAPDTVGPARRILREHLARAFAPEIARAGFASEVLLDALDTALSWDSWDCLRSDLRRSAANARRTFELVLRNLFGAPAPAAAQPQGRGS